MIFLCTCSLWWILSFWTRSFLPVHSLCLPFFVLQGLPEIFFSTMTRQCNFLFLGWMNRIIFKIVTSKTYMYRIYSNHRLGTLLFLKCLGGHLWEIYLLMFISKLTLLIPCQLLHKYLKAIYPIKHTSKIIQKVSSPLASAHDLKSRLKVAVRSRFWSFKLAGEILSPPFLLPEFSILLLFL